MIPTQRFITIRKSIHPPEADSLADELLSCSRQVDAYRQESDRIITELHASWSGNQKDTFMDSFTRIPMRLLFIAEMFRNHAETFRNLQVTVEETVPAAP
jgi:uncharacterized protein YukE